MAADQGGELGPDLTRGLPLSAFDERGFVRGHVGEEPVLVVRSGDRFHAVSSVCTHYGGPLDEGLIDGDTVWCPWHHACFSLRTGEALSAPAFDALDCWLVERRDGSVFVTGKETAPKVAAATAPAPNRESPRRIVIVGAGAAGFAAAEMLRRRGFDGEITMLSADADPPYDRPNLSKDYLAGKAPEDWIPLRPESFYTENRIGLELETEASLVDQAANEVVTGHGRSIPFDRLLLATGAEPIRPDISGIDGSNVFLLRSLRDSRAIIERAEGSRSAAILGAGFIGLEAAAALRSRGLDVHVVAPESLPLARILGPGLGGLVLELHRAHGVEFHLESRAETINERGVELDDGSFVEADLVVVGVGVRPRTTLAAKSGLEVDHGIVVNEYLETSNPRIFAAGDVARWRDRATSALRHVEHWVVAERHGQVAAGNMLGSREAFADPPFFWSAHYDVTIDYVGYAPDWDDIRIDGSVSDRDCEVEYLRDGKPAAIATIGRPLRALRWRRDRMDR